MRTIYDDLVNQSLIISMNLKGEKWNQIFKTVAKQSTSSYCHNVSAKLGEVGCSVFYTLLT